jgi:SAM-dependent methyltransferase
VILPAVAAAAAATAAVVRHRHVHTSRTVPGGTLIGDVAGYDRLSRLVYGRLFARIAADVAAAARDGAKVLEVGCGPGHLSILLAGRHDLDVTGVDLDPAMIERARANAAGAAAGDGGRRPSFLVADVAALAFPDRSFDLVVSTFSLHHWTDPSAGLAEMGRVLRPGGRALVWDLRPGVRPHLFGPRHAHIPDPVEHARGGPLRVAGAAPWRWPWRLKLAQRIDLVRAEGAG